MILDSLKEFWNTISEWFKTACDYKLLLLGMLLGIISSSVGISTFLCAMTCIYCLLYTHKLLPESWYTINDQNIPNYYISLAIGLFIASIMNLIIYI